MCDVVWEYKPPMRKPACYILAAESELDSTPERAAEDFGKLLCFKAPYKLLVFRSTVDHETVHKLISEDLLSYCHHIRGERYVFAEIEKLAIPTSMSFYEYAVDKETEPSKLAFSGIPVVSVRERITAKGVCDAARFYPEG